MRNHVVAWISAVLIGAAFAGEITVTGSGAAWGEPDQATVQVGWTGLEPEVGPALERANSAIAAIREALTEIGIDPLDLRTVGYDVWREERWDDGGEPHLVGYRVTHTLQVTVRDVDDLGDVIAVATGAGANQVGAVGFSIEDTEVFEREARSAAFRSARERARQLAELAGSELGDVASIEEIDAAGWTGTEAAYAMDGRGGAPVSAGRQTVQVVVRVTFETIDAP